MALRANRPTDKQVEEMLGRLLTDRRPRRWRWIKEGVQGWRNFVAPDRRMPSDYQIRKALDTLVQREVVVKKFVAKGQFCYWEWQRK